MINMISEYVRNLGIFLLFMSFVGLIAPSGKLKKYLNLVMGFVLLFLVISPIRNLTHHFDEILNILDNEMTVPVISMTEEEEATQMQRELVAKTASASIQNQLYEFLSEHEVLAKSIDVEIGAQEYNFLELLEIHIQLDPEKTSAGFIQIEKIRPFEARTDSEPEEARTLELKTLISDFYNVPLTNIYITHSKGWGIDR